MPPKRDTSYASVKTPALLNARARLAQSAERKALNLVVVGASPTVGVFSYSNDEAPTIPKKVTAVGFEPTPFRTGA